jgi:CheY-like chemotaxis protein
MTAALAESSAQGGNQREVNRLRILVVEDNDATAKMIRQWGHDVRAVGDATSALRTIEDANPDVLLVDLDLRGEIDAWQFVTRLKKRLGPKTPFLIALGAAGALRQSSADGGFDLHLTKPEDPVDLGDLLERFHAVLEI